MRLHAPSSPRTRRRLRGGVWWPLPWPVPALLAWAAAWAVLLVLVRSGVAVGVSLVAAMVVVMALCVMAGAAWRRRLTLVGFPLSVALTTVGQDAGPGLPWGWLLALLVLAWLYPVRRWADAPWYPTPAGALDALPAFLGDRGGAPMRVLDAGCGSGAGLRELHRVLPHARLEGVEWSWPLALVCRWRCRFATVRRGDFWRVDWGDYDLVYLFARPEAMPRAAAKAATELQPGALLVSLDFEATGWQADGALLTRDQRPLWVYRAPLQRQPGAAGDGTVNPYAAGPL